MKKATNKSDLTKDNIEGVIVYTGNIMRYSQYEWAIRIFDDSIDRRQIFAEKYDGKLEMVSAASGWHYDKIDDFIDIINKDENNSAEIVGYAETREEAVKITENHYKSNY